jgi:hypothetical protein
MQVGTLGILRMAQIPDPDHVRARAPAAYKKIPRALETPDPDIPILKETKTE